jgi:hypothetical protein
LTLGKILNNREATERIAKWAIELSMYDIVCKTKTVIKAQALSDFASEEQRCKRLLEKESWNIGPSISMVPYNFKAQEQEFW